MNKLAFVLLLLALPAVAHGQASTSLTPRVEFDTSLGTFVVELDAVRAPLTVENFLRYVRDGFYDGLIFHRVIPNFVVQTGGHDERFAERATRAPVPNESGNGLSNTRGSIGLARSESPHSGTSQFYVNLVDNLGLNPLPSRWGYTVFGRVVAGMEVIDRIGHVATGAKGPFPSDVPLKAVLIRRAWVVGEEPAAATEAQASATDAAAGSGAASGAEARAEPEDAAAGEGGEAQASAEPGSPADLQREVGEPAGEAADSPDGATEAGADGNAPPQ
jgi:cyclophilin family peptidyl-prolyl cis-trans isomerase